jgi:wyosine [tRNA(Phe)-imidazoG37] synthetase (radical SAM superfamily)
MSAPRTCCAYGPVPSRRLGTSLGINNIPAKVCSYACVYCQVGRTSRLRYERRAFTEPQTIFADVEGSLAKARTADERVDYLTFVPDGEPTLDLHLGASIDRLRTLGVPVGVISNSSLLWRADVRDELGRADWVSLKVDAVDETAWRRINRPHKALSLARILDGMRAFATTFGGRLVTETMLVRGINDGVDNIQALAAFLSELQPAIAYLGIPTRPPAEPWVRAPDAATLNRAYHILGDKLRHVEYLTGYEGNAFACTGNIATDLLAITAVHPMREEAVGALLARASSSWGTVERLVQDGQLAATEYEGHRFYLRRFAQSPAVT